MGLTAPEATILIGCFTCVVVVVGWIVVHRTTLIREREARDHADRNAREDRLRAFEGFLVEKEQIIEATSPDEIAKSYITRDGLLNAGQFRKEAAKVRRDFPPNRRAEFDRLDDALGSRSPDNLKGDSTKTSRDKLADAVRAIHSFTSSASLAQGCSTVRIGERIIAREWLIFLALLPIGFLTCFLLGYYAPFQQAAGSPFDEFWNDTFGLLQFRMVILWLTPYLVIAVLRSVWWSARTLSISHIALSLIGIACIIVFVAIVTTLVTTDRQKKREKAESTARLDEQYAEQQLQRKNFQEAVTWLRISADQWNIAKRPEDEKRTRQKANDLAQLQPHKPPFDPNQAYEVITSERPKKMQSDETRETQKRHDVFDSLPDQPSAIPSPTARP